jgi:tRNA pseudouridine38-40 synthase
MGDLVPAREPRLGPPPAEGMIRVRMRVAYNGAPFSGFAKNPDVRTVEADLEGALTLGLRVPTTISCAGRTDRGVHAAGQVVAFDAPENHFEAHALQRLLNRELAPDIVVDRLEQVASTFDARLSCTARSYRYHIINRPVADPLLHHLTWHVREPLDLDLMNAACPEIIGLHDFTAFSKKNKSRPDDVFLRRVHRAEWLVDNGIVRFDIQANAYTHQMVRSLVGMFVAIGLGRRRSAEMGEVLASMDRGIAPSPVPPTGLVLWRAHYDPISADELA